MIALRLAVVALALGSNIPASAANAVTSLGSTTMAATLALSSLPVGFPALTQLAGGTSGSCGVTATVQLGDTISSIISAYPALSSMSDLAALNPALNATQPLIAGLSLCVGGAGPAAWCNSPLAGGQCPTEAAGTLLVDWSTRNLPMTTALNEALTLTPDMGTILQDPATQASLFDIIAVRSLVMQIFPTNAAAKAVVANAGHPHLGLWLASGSTTSLTITIRPAWFPDGSAFYTFVPGSALDSLVAFPGGGGNTSWLSQLRSSDSSSLAQQAQSLLSATRGKRRLLQSNDPPAGGVKGSGCGSWCYGR